MIYKCDGIDERTIEKFEEGDLCYAVGLSLPWTIATVYHYANDQGSLVIGQYEAFDINLATPSHRDFIKNMITGNSNCTTKKSSDPSCALSESRPFKKE